MTIGDLRDRAAIVDDSEALRAAVRQDGYVFFRDLWDRTQILDTGRVFLTSLQQAGWTQPGHPPDDAPIALPPHPHDAKTAWTDPGFRAFGVSPQFNRLPYDRRVRRTVQNLMGASAFSYPLKVPRVVYPESIVPVHGGRYVHQDYGVIGVQDMFTLWMPLQDISRQRGGLAVRPGSHNGPLVRPHLLQGTEDGWLTADYEAGDALLFHCLTAHAALPNRTSRLRISGETRWQLADDPVPSHLILGPALRAPGELFARMFGRAKWWQPVPSGLCLVDRPQGGPHPAPGPSRYVTVGATRPAHLRFAHGFVPH